LFTHTDFLFISIVERYQDRTAKIETGAIVAKETRVASAELVLRQIFDDGSSNKLKVNSARVTRRVCENIAQNVAQRLKISAYICNSFFGKSRPKI
jgi:hypothetical protein